VIFSDPRGSLEIRFHEHNGAVKIVRPDGSTITIHRNSASHSLQLDPGEYRVEFVGDVDTVHVTRDRFQLERRGKVVVEVIENVPRKEAVAPAATQAVSPPANDPAKPPEKPFAISLGGLTASEHLSPVGKLPDWQHPDVFAELRSPGTLEYPVLAATSYVLETEVTLRQPKCFLHIQLGDPRFRVWVRLDWHEPKSVYRCKLQRFHGRGTWFLHWKHFPVDQRLKFRLVMREGRAFLFEGDRLILSNPSIAVQPQLRINFGGDNAAGATIHRCHLRPLTPAEEADAQVR
jgi:hypothetical protein